MKMYKIIILSSVFLLSSVNVLLSQEIIFPHDPLLLNEWSPINVVENRQSKYYSFDIAVEEQFVINLYCDPIQDVQMQLISADGKTILRSSYMFYYHESNILELGYNFITPGKYYVSIFNNGYTNAECKVGIFSLSKQLKDILELLNIDKVDTAFDQMSHLLVDFPDDPETNFHMAFLRLLNIIENPDSQLSHLFTLFDVKADIIPESVFEENFSNSQEFLSEIQNYAVSNLLPAIDKSLQNLEKVVVQKDVHIVVPSKLITPASQRIYYTWYEVDSDDVNILAGLLLITKSAILALHAFDLGVEPYVIKERFPSFDAPEDFDGFLIEYPNLLNGKQDIQSIFESSIKNWLLGTQKIRNSIASMKYRETPQETHVFFIKPDAVDTTVNYLKLMDRVFMGLYAVTGGDVNGDTRVDMLDLYTLRELY
jgi:hypothetical protein